MINVIIPDFMFLVEYSSCILRIFKEEREKFYEDINIVGVYGSYDTILDGESLFYMSANAAQIKAVSKEFGGYGVKMYFTYNNPLLDDKMIKDSVGRQYLRLTDVYGNKAIISNSYLEAELLSKEYNKEDIIYDMNKINHNSFLNQLSKENYIILKEDDNHNIELLKSLKNPEHIIIKNSSQCVDSCPYQTECVKNLMEFRLKMCEGIKKCPYNAIEDNYYRTAKTRKKFVDHDNFVNNYLPLGINTVLVGDIKTSAINKVESIVDFIVKPEFRDDVRFEILHKESVTDTLKKRKKDAKEN